MNLIRKYKISKLLNRPLERIEQDIIDYINTWISDLTIATFSQDAKYYFNDGKFVATHPNKPNNTKVYVRCNQLLDVLEKEYLMNKGEAHQLFLYLFNLKYNTNFDIVERLSDDFLCQEIETMYANNKKIQNL